MLKMSVPATINKHLRDYQRDGVRFLFRQYADKRGGILGDDMVNCSGVLATACSVLLSMCK